MKKKFKITFLFDKSNDWFKNYFKKININKKKYYIKKTYNKKKAQNQDILFIINYTKILPKIFLKKNKLNLVIHASKLPKDKGFAPVSYQVLRNKKIIYVSLIEAIEFVDSGNIYLQNKFKLDGTELYSEIRMKTADAMIKLIKTFLKIYPNNINIKKQKGISTFNKRRNLKNDELKINQSIKKQFNKLRVSDNNKFPSYFIYKKKKYLVKIYKED